MNVALPTAGARLTELGDLTAYRAQQTVQAERYRKFAGSDVATTEVTPYVDKPRSLYLISFRFDTKVERLVDAFTEHAKAHVSGLSYRGALHATIKAFPEVATSDFIADPARLEQMARAAETAVRWLGGEELFITFDNFSANGVPMLGWRVLPKDILLTGHFTTATAFQMGERLLTELTLPKPGNEVARTAHVTVTRFTEAVTGKPLAKLKDLAATVPTPGRVKVAAISVGVLHIGSQGASLDEYASIPLA